MSVELRPLGVNCNIACQYCYQNKHRDAGHLTRSYDIILMKEAIEDIGGPFHFFGGEPLLIKEEDLEELLAWGLERFGTNGVQTNGVLINNNHIRLFKEYNVQVGISIDGPGPLNDARWAGTLERTRSATQKSEQAIEKLCQAGITPGIIIQMNRCNCTERKLSLMCDWFEHLDRLGIERVRLHILEIENEFVRQKYALTIEENIAAYRCFAELEQKLINLRFDVSNEQKNLLLLQDNYVACVWRGCDPYTTEAVNGVGGHGERHNCGLTDKEGINFQKPTKAGYERYIALYHTPQEYGGCKGCKFFLVCKGQCPGTGINGDWRNRTENCEVWKSLFSILELELLNKGITPISVHSRRSEIEEAMLEAWRSGENPAIENIGTMLDIVIN